MFVRRFIVYLYNKNEMKFINKQLRIIIIIIIIITMKCHQNLMDFVCLVYII